MNSIKCNNCGLSNFVSDNECRRCRCPLQAAQKNVGKRPRRFSLIPIVVYGSLAAGGYYLYSGMQESVADVNAKDAQRVGTQHAPPQETPGLSRNEQDRKRAHRVGEMLKDNPSLNAQKKRDEETQKIIQQASNSSAR